MVFEEIFGSIGEKIEKARKNVKSKVNRSRENVSDEFFKKLNKLGEKISPDSKNLSNLERTAANIGIGLARSFEINYKKIKETLFVTEKERNTKYGELGKFWSKKYIPRERGKDSILYARIAEKRLSSKLKLKKEILRDIVESLSSSSTELYSYYIYGHIIGSKPTKTHDKKKEVIRKYLMSPKEKEFYENGKSKR